MGSAAASKTTSPSAATRVPARRSRTECSRTRSCRSRSAQKGKTTLVSVDEGPAKFDEAKLRALKPAFGPEGTITAGNASSISDGAAALLVTSRGGCDRLGLKPTAAIVGAATFSQQPEWFTTAPVEAIRKLLDKVGWTVDQVDLFEINEAFAVVAMFAERELEIPAQKINILRRGRRARASRSAAAELVSW